MLLWTNEPLTGGSYHQTAQKELYSNFGQEGRLGLAQAGDHIRPRDRGRQCLELATGAAKTSLVADGFGEAQWTASNLRRTAAGQIIDALM
jgi:hypothetical protein